MSKKQIKRASVNKKQIDSSLSQSKEAISASNGLQSSVTASNQDKKSSPSESVTPHSESVTPQKERITFYGRIHKLSKTGRKYLKKKLLLAIPGVSLFLLGFKPLPQNIPILNFAEEHRVASPIIGGVLIILFVIGMIISYLPEPNQNNSGKAPKKSLGWRIRPLAFATGLSTVSCIISTSLLILVLIRPSWCPNSLCLAPQALIFGPHDANLEVNFTAIQSPTYVLMKDPSHYSLSGKDLPRSTDPTSIGAFRIDQGKTTSPYLVAMNIHNIRSNGFSMIIEEVALVVKPASPIPHPLNVWSVPPSLMYQSENLYNMAYAGQSTNAVLPATYVHLPGGNVQLKPLESDSIALQVTPHLIAATALRFSILITYRFANESLRYTFSPPYIFEVIFAKSSNWNPYHLQDGRLLQD